VGAWSGGEAYVFGHPATGERTHSIKTAWKRAITKSQIPDLHFHDLRREAASRWLDAGGRLSAVSKLLGHTTTEQTATYLACVVGAEP
jgi:integrase